ncbi:hypothetical protein AVEN_123799-1 [Araneus ventricosus]|uniref:Uncharacterized protein n=1 Tax=Araneus ventricosus TaxID=182803 RepID=A0A4Y2BKQ1_ARAVE|nr:hypothetical protein AVEN_123799-1 [Araneus ventricosus]
MTSVAEEFGLRVWYLKHGQLSEALHSCEKFACPVASRNLFPENKTFLFKKAESQWPGAKVLGLVGRVFKTSDHRRSAVNDGLVLESRLRDWWVAVSRLVTPGDLLRTMAWCRSNPFEVKLPPCREAGSVRNYGEGAAISSVILALLLCVNLTKALNTSLK